MLIPPHLDLDRHSDTDRKSYQLSILEKEFDVMKEMYKTKLFCRKRSKVSKKKMSLLDGKYRVEGSWYNMLEVDGDKAVLHEPTGNTYDMTFKYGEFGEAHADIAEKMSQETNNLEFSFSSGGQDYTEEGVVGEDGTVVMMKGAMGVCNMSWMTEEEAAAYEAEGDPIEAPSCPYDLQPGNIGKLVWLDGPPCSGKSVSAQLLANTRGYVYYEGDCFGSGKNPYIPLDAEDPSMAMLSQRTLKGEGMEDRARLGMKVWEVSGKREENEEEWLETMSEFYSLMCEDIMRERARVGGDWVVTTCLTGKDVRSVIRSGRATG